jgi:cellulose synthase/poly-beta-1,6-N-acetylglucosamine synthase-like glycosyltransferase
VSVPPPVSVLLPVRDGAAHLSEAIASLEAQSFADFEVLAVDDGSVDDTPQILANWAARDARVRVVSQAAAGIVTALERARKEAAGRYLARMDADDVSHPQRFAKQFDLMQADASVAGCGCHVRYFPDEAVRGGARRYEAWMNGSATPAQVEREIFVECPLAHPTFFHRADAVAAVGGYRKAGWPEDYDLIFRLWEQGGALAKVPEVLLRWREAPDRLSRTDPLYSLDAFRACKVHYLGRTLLAGGRGAVVWGAGPVGKTLARALTAKGTPVRAFVEVDARKIGQTIYEAPVLATEEGLQMADCLHLGAVGQEGARETIRGLLAGAGKVELQDFVLTA